MTMFCAEAFSLIICACLDSYTAPNTTLKLGGFPGTRLEQPFLRTWAHSGLFHHLQYENQGRPGTESVMGDVGKEAW